MKHEFINHYKNIRIRPLEECDIEFIRNWRNNPKNTKFLSKISYITPEMQMKWYKNILEKPNEYVFAIDEIKELNRLVGSFSLYNIVDEEAEFGKFLIGEDKVHGKSIGLYTLIAALQISFNELKLQKVYLKVYKDNIAALKVYKKVGFIISNPNNLSCNELIMEMRKQDFIQEGF